MGFSWLYHLMSIVTATVLLRTNKVLYPIKHSKSWFCKSWCFVMISITRFDVFFPQYLIDLLKVRNNNAHNLRLDNDFFLLETPPPANLRNTFGAFSYSGPAIWNSLPYNLRCLSDINLFKTRLKTHYFEHAFYNKWL